jgi:hypothetical protein
MGLGLFAAFFIFVALNSALAEVRIEASNGGVLPECL